MNQRERIAQLEAKLAEAQRGRDEAEAYAAALANAIRWGRCDGCADTFSEAGGACVGEEGCKNVQSLLFKKKPAAIAAIQEELERGRKLREEVDSLRTALNQQGHVVEFRSDGWGIEHTVECRKTSLLDCPLNFLVEDMGGPPSEGLGRYRAAVDSSGNLLLALAQYERLRSESRERDPEAAPSPPSKGGL